MNISKYQKIFGIGPVGVAISLVLLSLLWLFDIGLGHVRILRDPAPIRIIGLILIGIWICWHAWAIRIIRSWWSRDQLCTTGPYRLVRHPIYTGALLLAEPGLALIFNSWVVLSWPVLMYPVWSVLVRNEEKMMTAVFGEKYRLYAAKTGRFFPRVLK